MKCRKAKKKIAPLVEDALYSLQETSTAGFIISRRIVKVEEELFKFEAKLENMNRFYKFVSANLRVQTLGAICKKLEDIERDLDNAIPLAQMMVQVSILFGATSNENTSEETNLLLYNARQAFGTHVLRSQLDRLVSGNSGNEGTHYLIMGKMYLQGLTVKVVNERSAFFFQCAVNYGNGDAFSYPRRCARNYFKNKATRMSSVEQWSHRSSAAKLFQLPNSLCIKPSINESRLVERTKKVCDHYSSSR